MGFDIHTVESIDNSILSRTDRVLLLNLPAQHNNAGGSAGATVAVPVTGVVLPSSYSVVATPSQACFVSVGSKSNTGFVLTLAPTLSSVTLAAGTVDIVVIA